MKLALSAGLAALILPIAACSTQSMAAERKTTLFTCAGDRSFSVERDDRVAIVVYDDVRYELPRRKSSIGQKYATSGTTLIIDGDMAAFVSGAVLDLDLCHTGSASA